MLIHSFLSWLIHLYVDSFIYTLIHSFPHATLSPTNLWHVVFCFHDQVNFPAAPIMTPNTSSSLSTPKQCITPSAGFPNVPLEIGLHRPVHRLRTSRSPGSARFTRICLQRNRALWADRTAKGRPTQPRRRVPHYYQSGPKMKYRTAPNPHQYSARPKHISPKFTEQCRVKFDHWCGKTVSNLDREYLSLFRCTCYWLSIRRW